METVKIEALAIELYFYCARAKLPCERKYTCIMGGGLFLDRICPYLVAKAPAKEIHETIERGVK